MRTDDGLEKKKSVAIGEDGAPCSLCRAALYSKSNILKLPFSGLAEELMASRTWESLQYRESMDPEVALADFQHTDKSLQVAESRLRLWAFLGSTATAAVGYFLTARVNNVQGKGRQHLQQEINGPPGLCE